MFVHTALSFLSVCLQLRGGYAVAMSESQSQEAWFLVSTHCIHADSCISPENASCLEGSLHSSGSSGCISGRTWGRTCICRERETERETNELVQRAFVCHWKYSKSYCNNTHNTNKTNKTAVADKAHTLSHPHPSVVYDKGSFLCKNSSGILSKMLPCISISELLSQLAINSPGQTQAPPAAEPCDGGCAVATMQHSVAIPASLNLSVRDHINSTCHALLIGWDGKYGYPHQYLMRGGREEGGSEE